MSKNKHKLKIPLVPVTLKILFIFLLFILISNISTNYINLAFNRSTHITLMKKLLEKDLQIMTEIAKATALGLENIKMGTKLLNSYKGTVEALVSLADAKETSGGGHSRRVAEYALSAASGLSLSKETKEIIEYAAILHDIGKLSIPDAVLNKAGKSAHLGLQHLFSPDHYNFTRIICQLEILKNQSEQIIHVTAMTTRIHSL